MEANIKKTVLDLKNNFDEGKRITPKLLRDFLVSVFGSTYVSKVADSMDIGAEEDTVIVTMTEGNNYVRLPDSKGVDVSETPYDLKRYTIINDSADNSFRLMTQSNDSFKSADDLLLQEIVIKSKQVYEVVATDGQWFAYIVGEIPDTLMATSDIFTKFSFLCTPTAVTVVDTVNALTNSVKWNVRIEDDVSEQFRTSELMFGKTKTDGDSVEYSIIGDVDMGVELFVSVDDDGIISLSVNNTLENAVTVKLLRYEIG